MKKGIVKAMIVYHCTKTKRGYKGILKKRTLQTNGQKYAFVSLTPFEAGSFAVDVIGADSNRAWLFTLEIPGNTFLEDDPTGEDKIYAGTWKVCGEDIPILRIIKVEHIPDVRQWEFEAAG